MQKYFAMIFILILISTACNARKPTETIDSTTWKQIVNKEWSSSSYEPHGPGSGLYFYEKNNINYCIFLVYGSGLPIVSSYTSAATVEAQGVISILLPETLEAGHLKINKKQDKLVEVKLKYEGDIIKLGKREFKENPASLYERFMQAH